MLSFWVNIDESDIEAYAGTLILPEYMSHLSLAPFKFSNQPHNPDGRQSLVLTYIGEGRIEELSISPKKNALALLHFTVPAMEPGSVKLPNREAIWNWSVNTRHNQAGLNENGLRIYFEPKRKTLNSLENPIVFSPFQTYVSVSRRELFIGIQILTAYFQTWIAQITGSKVEHEPDRPIDLQLNITSNGFAFSNSRVGGELLLEDDEVFRDIINFSGLNQPLAEIGQYAVPDLDSSGTQIGDAGILLKLVLKKT